MSKKDDAHRRYLRVMTSHAREVDKIKPLKNGRVDKKGNSLLDYLEADRKLTVGALLETLETLEQADGQERGRLRSRGETHIQGRSNHSKKRSATKTKTAPAKTAQPNADPFGTATAGRAANQPASNGGQASPKDDGDGDDGSA